MTTTDDIRYTLLTDGSSDAILLSHITWLLQQHTQRPTRAEWADFSRLRHPPRTLSERIRTALDLYPCDLLCVHRDAERERYETRIAEIRAQSSPVAVPTICIVPVRMQEAWLLFDENAIRRAAGNPNGNMPLSLPPLREIEAIADPKALLHDMLRTASGYTGRRRRDFSPHRAAHSIGRYLDGFDALRALPAFAALERDIIDALAQLGWLRRPMSV